MNIKIMIHANWLKSEHTYVSCEMMETCLFHYFLGAIGPKQYQINVDIAKGAEDRFDKDFPVTSSVSAPPSALVNPQKGFELADLVQVFIERFALESQMPTLLKQKEAANG